MLDEQWIVLLPPGPGASAATPIGLFESESTAYDWLAKQATETQLHARVLKVSPPPAG